MPTRPRPQKSRSGSPGDTRPRPLVGPGAPPRRRPARPATHPPRPRHRLVALATRPPGRRTALTPEAKNATVVLAPTPAPVAQGVSSPYHKTGGLAMAEGD